MTFYEEYEDLANEDVTLKTNGCKGEHVATLKRRTAINNQVPGIFSGRDLNVYIKITCLSIQVSDHCFNYFLELDSLWHF